MVLIFTPFRQLKNEEQNSYMHAMLHIHVYIYGTYMYTHMCILTLHIHAAHTHKHTHTHTHNACDCINHCGHAIIVYNSKHWLVFAHHINDMPSPFQPHWALLWSVENVVAVGIICSMWCYIIPKHHLTSHLPPTECWTASCTVGKIHSLPHWLKKFDLCNILKFWTAKYENYINFNIIIILSYLPWYVNQADVKNNKALQWHPSQWDREKWEVIVQF